VNRGGDANRPPRAEGDGPRKRRRRRGRGGSGGEGMQTQGGQQQNGQRPQGGGFNRDRDGRGNQPHRQGRDQQPRENNSAPKGSLWQRLKSTLGLGGGGGDLGGKW
jgi:hypothetical protein